MSAATAVNEPSIDTKKKKGKKGEKEERTEYETKDDFQPFTAEVTVVGTAPMLFHRYDPELIKKLSELPKGAAEKKIDHVEHYVYRDEDNNLCMPGVNFKACLKNAAKRFKDPSSPRRSAHDLIGAGIVVTPYLAPIKREGVLLKDWDAMDVRPVVIKRDRITRHRPMLYEGWSIDFQVGVIDSEHITGTFLHKLISRAGLFSGLGDFRPDFGGFRLDSFIEVKMV